MSPLDNLYHGAEADLFEAASFLERLAIKLSAPDVLSKSDRRSAALALGRHARTINRIAEHSREHQSAAVKARHSAALRGSTAEAAARREAAE